MPWKHTNITEKKVMVQAHVAYVGRRVKRSLVIQRFGPNSRMAERERFTGMEERVKREVKLLACGRLVHFRRVALTHFLRARKRAFQDPL